jgi:hypothetical protein
LFQSDCAFGFSFATKKGDHFAKTESETIGAPRDRVPHYLAHHLIKTHGVRPISEHELRQSFRCIEHHQVAGSQETFNVEPSLGKAVPNLVAMDCGTDNDRAIAVLKSRFSKKTHVINDDAVIFRKIERDAAYPRDDANAADRDA